MVKKATVVKASGGPQRTCPQCSHSQHARRATCQQCGFIYPAPEPKAPKAPKLKAPATVKGSSNGLADAMAFVETMGSVEKAKAALDEVWRLVNWSDKMRARQAEVAEQGAEVAEEQAEVAENE